MRNDYYLPPHSPGLLHTLPFSPFLSFIFSWSSLSSLLLLFPLHTSFYTPPLLTPLFLSPIHFLLPLSPPSLCFFLSWLYFFLPPLFFSHICLPFFHPQLSQKVFITIMLTPHRLFAISLSRTQQAAILSAR